MRFSERGEGGAFVGHGYLVVGIGTTWRRTYSPRCRNPPTGQAALSGTSLFARANELLPPVDGLAYYLTDMNQYAKTTMRTLNTVLDLTLKVQNDDDSELTTTLRTLQKLLPSEDELEGILGVEVGQAVAGPHGLGARSIVELPGPGR